MGFVVDVVNSIVACVSVASMGAKEVIAKGFVKPVTDDVVLVLIMGNVLVGLLTVVLDKLVKIQSVDTGEKQN